MKTICKRENCTGCGACVNACPKSCISLDALGGIGHVYPVIEELRCLECGVCKKVCPQNKLPNLIVPQKTYAAFSLDEKERKIASSGGLASYFTRKILENGGVVYGCSSNLKDRKICHIRCENKEQAQELRGSKYVQSSMEDCYQHCKTDLLEGKEVLFIGLPCQIAGLKSFLGKEQEHLTTVDLICHGVAPQKLLFEHLVDCKSEAGTNISFRSPSGYRLIVRKAEQTLLNVNSIDDLYYIGFLAGLYFRKSCYQCRYATKERIGDLTLGDFWGLGKEIPFDGDIKDGVSLLLVNTDKGGSLLARYREGLFFVERTLQEAQKENQNLVHPSPKHRNTEKFSLIYSKQGFKKAAKKCLKKEILKYKIVKISEKSGLVRTMVRLVRKAK
ncbi:MAG: Coenzyme F420 hydrogenase/dehydrogenase, beta subunit C-terminal domain [Clostridia bacterium]|nr:Coenzyme F420 hydrogenase/dehydrogenase, beta subunit C-terminal domain [Clostridia bacterium]